MAFNIIYTAIATGVSLAYAGVLFLIGQSRKSPTWLFYSLLYLPLAIFLLVYLGVSMIWQMGISMFLLGVFLIERLVWGYTLRRVSGEDKLSWFFIIFYFPVIGWLFYWATRWR